MWSPLRRIAEVALGPEIRQQQRKAVQAVERQQVLFEASVAQLRQEVLDRTKRDYIQVSGDDAATEFDRETIGRVIAHSRALALKNPLVQRAIDVMVLYCFGQGVSIEAEADGDKDNLTKIIEDPKNRAELFGPEGLEACEREIDATGNLFLMLWGRDNGFGIPQVRCAPVEEFKKIVTNPDDRKEVWFYLRETQTPTGEMRKTYHPDVMHQPKDRPPEYDGEEILWNIPVAHYAVGGFHHWKWGLPKLYAAGDWATAYKGFLEDLATVIRSLSRYAHKLTVNGASPSQVQAAAVALRSSVVGNYSDGGETNPPPAAGSTWVQNDQAKMEVFKASGMHVDGDSGRRLLLMFAAGVGLPETFFADLANSNLATAKALDRPTELLFLMRQTLWKRILADIAGWGIAQMSRTNVRDNSGALPKVKVDFPPILEHDVAETVAATISAMTLDGKKVSKLFHGAEREMARLLFQALGVDDAADILDEIEKAGGFEIDDEPDTPPPGPPGMPQPPQSEARVIRMFERIRQKIEEQEKAA